MGESKKCLLGTHWDPSCLSGFISGLTKPHTLLQSQLNSVLNKSTFVTPLSLCMYCSLHLNYSFFSSPTSEIFFFFTILQCFQVQHKYHLLSEDGPIQLSQTELSFLPVCPQHFVLTSFRRVNTVLSFVLTYQHLSLDLRSLKAWGDTFKLI